MVELRGLKGSAKEIKELAVQRGRLPCSGRVSGYGEYSTSVAARDV